jgi:hypothetical protein
VARSFSRISLVLVPLWDGVTGKWVSSFTHPTAAGNNDAETDLFTYRFAAGAQRFPEYDPQSIQEIYYRLAHALSHSGQGQALGQSYQVNDFVIGQSFERAGGPHHSGISTRGGATLSIDLRNTGTSTMAHVVVIFDAALDLSQAGPQMLD